MFWTSDGFRPLGLNYLLRLVCVGEGGGRRVEARGEGRGRAQHSTEARSRVVILKLTCLGLKCNFCSRFKDLFRWK